MKKTYDMYINLLKNYNKRTIDIYELMYEKYKSSIEQLTHNEIDDFIQNLWWLHDNSFIILKKSMKGEKKLNLINRKVNINKGKFIDLSDDVGLDLLSNHMKMNPSYYLKNLGQYYIDRPHIDRLKMFLHRNSGELTLNEISYLVFNDEKALLQPENASVNGKRILNNLQLEIDDFQYVDTISPFYYPICSNGDTVLVIENKDTCFSLLRVLAGRQSNIKGIIFGEGRAVNKIFKFLYLYNLDTNVLFLYYGDIDQEGFDIARSLIEKHSQYNIKLSKFLYHSLLRYERRSLLKKRTIDTSKSEYILRNLFDEDKIAINEILACSGCIPQEALNYDDMKDIMNELQYRLF